MTPPYDPDDYDPYDLGQIYLHGSKRSLPEEARAASLRPYPHGHPKHNKPGYIRDPNCNLCREESLRSSGWTILAPHGKDAHQILLFPEMIPNRPLNEVEALIFHETIISPKLP